MRKGILGALAALLAGAGLVVAQTAPPGSPPGPPGSPPGPVPTTITPDQIATPEPTVMDSTHPWNPPVPKGDCWPYIDEPWRVTDRRCVPDGEFWISADYLLWAVRESRLPPLVSTGPASSGGVLGRPGTATLFGGSGADLGPFSGGRFTAGVWTNDEHDVGFEGSYFGLPQRSTGFSAVSAGGAVLALPFVNAVTGREDAVVVAGPGRTSGGVNVYTSTQLQGVEANVVCDLTEECHYRVELLAGFRYLELADNLNSTADFAVAPTAAVGAGDQLTVVDEFDTRNHFYGGQVGARAEYHWGAFLVSAALTVGLGDNVEKVVVGGSTTVVPPHARVGRGPAGHVTFGGVLTQPSNIGEYNADQFAAILEQAVSVGYQINGHVRLFVGYDILFWSDVVRSGSQIDRAINPGMVRAVFPAGRTSGPDQPTFSFHETGFWAQGGTFGVEFNY
jgi:hypothetical protein